MDVPSHLRRRVRIVAFVATAGCAQTPPAPPGPADSAPTEREAPAETAPGGAPSLVRARVANRDPGSVGREPDYDAEARTLAARIGPRVPAGGDPKAACRAMLDAARRRYAAVDTGPEVRARILEDLDRTRAADETACRTSLTPRAARCAALLLDEEQAELDHAVDRCARAFPAADR